MGSHRVSQSYKFNAIHRVLNYGAEYEHFHGHLFRAVITAEQVDPHRPRIAATLEQRIAPWFAKAWDRKFLIWSEDPLQPALSVLIENLHVLPFNCTLENFAQYIVEQIGPSQLMGTGVRITACRFHSTRSDHATFALPEPTAEETPQ